MVSIGDRVKITGVMENDPIMVGTEGTVNYVSELGGYYGVHWDNGRTLLLLGSDPFIVVKRAAWHVVHEPEQT